MLNFYFSVENGRFVLIDKDSTVLLLQNILNEDREIDIYLEHITPLQSSQEEVQKETQQHEANVHVVKTKASEAANASTARMNEPIFMTQERGNEVGKKKAEPQFMSQQRVNIIKPAFFMAGPSASSLSTRDASAILNGSNKFASLSSLQVADAKKKNT
ncbi:hypothetical protein LguiB_027274 [Lonicera macranthoides]